MPATSVRSAVAVRPPRPITLTRSSWWTCTSTVRPRRLVTMSTRTSSGLSTIPRTKCSTASTTTALMCRSALAGLGLLAAPGRRVRRRGAGGSFGDRLAGGGLGSLSGLGGLLDRRLLLRLGGLGGGRAVGGGQRGVEQLQLAGLGRADLQPALGPRQPLEL